MTPHEGSYTCTCLSNASFCVMFTYIALTFR